MVKAFLRKGVKCSKNACLIYHFAKLADYEGAKEAKNVYTFLLNIFDRAILPRISQGVSQKKFSMEKIVFIDTDLTKYQPVTSDHFKNKMNFHDSFDNIWSCFAQLQSGLTTF